MKKILSIVLAVMLIAGVVPMASAAEAKVSISPSASGVTNGDQVSFKIVISGSALGAYNYTLSYDSSMLEFIGFSGDGDANGGGGAVIAAGDCGEAKGVASFTTTVSFKTKQVGTANVSLGNMKVADYETMAAATISGSTTSSVNIAAKPEASTDNTLKALSVSPSSLSPAFSKDVTEYTMTVDYPVSSIVVSATPNDSKAKVKTSGSSSLSVGENTVKVVVTAESGSTKTYIIKVTRKPSDYAGITAEVNGLTYNVGYEIDSANVPESYTAGESDFGDRKILTYSAPNNGITIAWLTDSEGNGKWFIYDASTQTFKNYISVSSVSNNFVILEKPETEILPEGFAADAEDITIGETMVKGYKAEGEGKGDFYLIYAMDANGISGYYLFDSVQNTIQRFAAFQSVQAVAPVEPETPDDATPDTEPKASPIAKYALLGAAGLLFVGGIVLLVILFRKPPEENEEDEEIE